jgi:hypothetical protein
MRRVLSVALLLVLLLPQPALAQGLELPSRSNREIRDGQDAERRGEQAAAEEPGDPSIAPDAPFLRVVFEATEAVPGQPLSLRLTVLVPTFMPAPPVWPTLEAPNLLVRLPERSTNPTSERIGGETWSGITRHYRISPMVPGDFAIPAQDVVVTWNDPASGNAGKTVLRTEPIAFSGVLPEGAAGLDPFIAAEGLELVQTIEGSPEAMRPGDSVTRTLTAAVRGASPMFLPPLLPTVAIEGVAAYPDEAVLAEQDERGRLGGTRQESVTLVAEGGGTGEVPAVSLDWYDLDNGEVATATVEGFVVNVDGPPASRAAPRDWRAIGLALAAGLVALALLVPLARRDVPPLRRWLADRRAAWLASEAVAWRQLQRAVARRDHAALRPALDGWAARVAGADPRRDPHLQEALAALGAARYAAGNGGDPAAAWRALAAALPAARRATADRLCTEMLPPLNPGR